MFTGIGKLAPQELRLNLHGLLKIGCVNQFPRMLEGRLHILFGEREGLLGNLRCRIWHRGYRFARGIKKQAESFFRLIDGFFGQIAQFGWDFQFRFNHVALLWSELSVTTFPARRLCRVCCSYPPSGSFIWMAKSRPATHFAALLIVARELSTRHVVAAAIGAQGIAGSCAFSQRRTEFVR
jgi:hypothetical protein